MSENEANKANTDKNVREKGEGKIAFIWNHVIRFSRRKQWRILKWLGWLYCILCQTSLIFNQIIYSPPINSTSFVSFEWCDAILLQTKAEKNRRRLYSWNANYVFPLGDCFAFVLIVSNWLCVTSSCRIIKNISEALSCLYSFGWVWLMEYNRRNKNEKCLQKKHCKSRLSRTKHAMERKKYLNNITHKRDKYPEFESKMKFHTFRIQQSHQWEIHIHTILHHTNIKHINNDGKIWNDAYM